MGLGWGFNNDKSKFLDMNAVCRCTHKKFSHWAHINRENGKLLHMNMGRCMESRCPCGEFNASNLEYVRLSRQWDREHGR